MQLLKDFRTKLVTAVPGSTVVPVFSKTTTLPSVVYSMRGGYRQSFFSGSYGLRSTTIQLDIYSQSYDNMVGTREAIISAFNGTSGVWGTTTISRCAVTNVLETFEDKGERLFRTIIELEIMD